MRVRLLRSWTNAQGTKYPVGQYLDLWPPFAKKLISERYCVADDNRYPEKKKTKTNFFKPK